MESKIQLSERIQAMGVKKKFKPFRDPGSGAVMLQVRNPALVLDGLLVGLEIDVYDKSTFRIWTGRKQKAKACARRYRLTVRLLDGEAELFAPAHLADEILPEFGAKVKRVLSESALEAARAGMASANKRLALKNIG